MFTCMCVCVCVCVCVSMHTCAHAHTQKHTLATCKMSERCTHAHTHTHTHMQSATEIKPDAPDIEESDTDIPEHVPATPIFLRHLAAQALAEMQVWVYVHSACAHTHSFASFIT
jgi:hypothetical protein